MTKRTLKSMEQCLFTAFANSDWDDPQEPRQMWAIQEGVRRAYSGYNGWRPTDARKDHECIRGCGIKRGDVYFKMPLGGGWGNDLKACAGCMAMILYGYGYVSYKSLDGKRSKKCSFREWLVVMIVLNLYSSHKTRGHIQEGSS